MVAAFMGGLDTTAVDFTVARASAAGSPDVVPLPEALVAVGSTEAPLRTAVSAAAVSLAVADFMAAGIGN
jgi:hypothetical protein